jgi:hypothetical protein
VDAKKNLFWEILEPLVREPAPRTPQKKLRPRAPSKAVKAARPRKPAVPAKGQAKPLPRASRKALPSIPTHPERNRPTQGHQLLDLRGWNGFRIHLLVAPNTSVPSEIEWPEILAQPGVYPGELLNSLNFLVRNPHDIEPRRFKFLKQLEWEKIFMEETKT